MVSIVNVSSGRSSVWLNDYEVRINQEVIARFQHRGVEGLTVCLQKAAAAVERTKWEKEGALLKKMEKG